MDEVRQDVGELCDTCGGSGVIERPYIAGVVNVMHGCQLCSGTGRARTHPTLPEQLPEAGITIGEEG